MDATHFRQRAARAREMAKSGDDVRISRMLLEVATDLEAEADAIDAEGAAERRRSARLRPSILGATLSYTEGDDPTERPVQILDLSAGGAKLRTAQEDTPGARVVLSVPENGIRLHGTIMRVGDTETAILFDPQSSTMLDLERLLRSDWLNQPEAMVSGIA